MRDVAINTIVITYSVAGYEEAGETSFDMDVSDSIYENLQNAEDEYEFLDSNFISVNMKGVHKKILKAIRENLEDESMNPYDGMVEKSMPWGYKYKEYEPAHSHSEMNISAEDDDIEYEVSLY